jgi:hypothetical protein
MTDPTMCGCQANTSTTSGCWPSPTPPQCNASGHCGPGGAIPQHPPTDFGCGGSTGS